VQSRLAVITLADVAVIQAIGVIDTALKSAFASKAIGA
jgi:hypothetical protein